MKTTLIIASLLLLVSCGAKKQYHKKLNVHPEAQTFLSTFEEKYGVKVDDLDMTFAALSDAGVLGYCQKSVRTEKRMEGGALVEHVYATPVIVLNTKYWDRIGTTAFTDSDKEQLVYHELGHCVLNRPHVEEKVTSSIMNPYHKTAAWYGNIYERNYSNFMIELFNRPALASAGLSFDPTPYASTIFPEFQEIEVEDLHADDLHDCVNDKGSIVVEVIPEVTEEN